jgi:Spy/CpxP family protein refolding chaperone
MKRLLTGFTVTLVAAVWMMGSCFFNPIAAYAQDTGAAKCKCGEHWKHRHGHHHFWKKLNLTDAQKKEMFSIRLDERAKMKPLVQKLKEGREQLQALPKGKFDEAKVRSIAKGQADIITELIVEKQRMKSMMYAVLTPEQRAKAEQMRESWKARHGKEAEHND